MKYINPKKIEDETSRGGDDVEAKNFKQSGKLPKGLKLK